jgi:hypothetical protein
VTGAAAATSTSRSAISRRFAILAGFFRC